MESEPTAGFKKKFQYNNVMYIAAGEAIASAHNSTYEAIVASRILQPLAMAKTNFSIAAMQQSPDFAYGYSNDEKTERLPMPLLGSVAAAGGIISNAKEMGQWLRLLTGEGVIDGKRILSEKGFQALLTKEASISGDTSYCLGLFVRVCEDWPGHPIYYHRGNLGGYNAEFYVIPDQRLGFAVLTNVHISKLPRETLKAVIGNLGVIP
jgi:CubicO group peptidase (beta-lactamase class C family)